MNKIKKIPEDKKKDSSLLYFLGHFFLLSLIIIAINQFLKRQIVINFMPELIVLSIALGFLTFYANKERAKKELDDKKEKEEAEEEKRKKEFLDKFPLINKVPILRGFVKWIYKEGWWYGLGLILIVVLGFVLMVWNLNFIPYVDEYSHLVSAKDIVGGNGLEYSRALILTFGVSLFYYIFGIDIFYARMFTVLLASLSLIPIYLFFKLVSKRISLLTVALLAISPWFISISRNVREYAIFPFFFFLLLILNFNIINKIKERDKIQLKYVLFYITFISLIFFYSFFIDNLSTFKFILLMIIPTNLYLFLKDNQRLSGRKYLIFIVLLSISVFVVFSYFNKNVTYVGITFEDSWIKLIFSEGQYFSWNNLPFASYFVVFFISLGIVWGFQLKDDRYILIALTTLFILVTYTFIFERYFRPRYIYYILPFIIFLISYGISKVFKIVSYLFKKRIVRIIPYFILIIILTSSISITPALKAATWDDSGYNPYTGEYHDAIPSILLENKDKLLKDDVKIVTGTPYLVYYFLDLHAESEKVYKYDYSDVKRLDELNNFILKEDKGYIILDWRRNGRWSEGLPRENFVVENELVSKEVTLLEEGSWFIYYWGKD